MSVKIKYHVTQTLTFNGTAEVEEDLYEAMQKASDADNETVLGDLILDHIDQSDPQDWSVESVDEFKKIS
jgi:hypothetical protein